MKGLESFKIFRKRLATNEEIPCGTCIFASRDISWI